MSSTSANEATASIADQDVGEHVRNLLGCVGRARSDGED